MQEKDWKNLKLLLTLQLTKFQRKIIINRLVIDKSVLNKSLLASHQVN